MIKSNENIKKRKEKNGIKIITNRKAIWIKRNENTNEANEIR